MNINFEYYKIFYYVAKYGSSRKPQGFLETASQILPALMNCLENEIHCKPSLSGQTAVSGSHRRVNVFTQEYLPPWHNYNGQREELTESTGLEHGSISIGASETAISIYPLERAWKIFHMTYPGIRLQNFVQSFYLRQLMVKTENRFRSRYYSYNGKTSLKEVKLQLSGGSDRR